MEFVFFWIVLSIAVGVIAGSKGRTGFGYFMLSLLLSPLIIGIVVLAMPKVVPAGQRETAETHTRCPACKEVVRRDAIKCKHCGSTLTPKTL